VEGLLPPLHPGSKQLHASSPMVFRGTFDYSLDAKNRLTVPARFRAALAEGVVLAKGLERCVALWTPSGYDAYTQSSLAGFHPLSDEARKLKRFFAANSLDTELDGAGRVMMPPFLVDHAGLGKEVTVTGAGDNLEIWDRVSWTEYNAALASDITDITASLGHTA
jgi:MraZ protein